MNPDNLNARERKHIRRLRRRAQHLHQRMVGRADHSANLDAAEHAALSWVLCEVLGVGMSNERRGEL